MKQALKSMLKKGACVVVNKDKTLISNGFIVIPVCRLACHFDSNLEQVAAFVKVEKDKDILAEDKLFDEKEILPENMSKTYLPSPLYTRAKDGRFIRHYCTADRLEWAAYDIAKLDNCLFGLYHDDYVILANSSCSVAYPVNPNTKHEGSHRDTAMTIGAIMPINNKDFDEFREKYFSPVEEKPEERQEVTK